MPRIANIKVMQRITVPFSKIYFVIPSNFYVKHVTETVAWLNEVYEESPCRYRTIGGSVVGSIKESIHFMKDKMSDELFQKQINEFVKKYPIEKELPSWVHGGPKILTNLRNDFIIFNAFLLLHRTGEFSLPCVTPSRKMKRTPSRKMKKTPNKKKKKKENK